MKALTATWRAGHLRGQFCLLRKPSSTTARTTNRLLEEIFPAFTHFPAASESASYFAERALSSLLTLVHYIAIQILRWIIFLQLSNVYT